jgi:hypothetical protein
MSITPIPAEMKMAVIELHGWNCLCCGRPMHRYPDSRVRPDTLSFDHVLPEKFGGLTVIENLQPLCMACNLHKGIQTIDLREAAGQWNHRLHRAQRFEASRPLALGSEAQPERAWRRAFIGAPRVWITPLWVTQNPKYEGHPLYNRTDMKHWNWPMLRDESKRMPPCPVRDKMVA